MRKIINFFVLLIAFGTIGRQIKAKNTNNDSRKQLVTQSKEEIKFKKQITETAKEIERLKKEQQLATVKKDKQKISNSLIRLEEQKLAMQFTLDHPDVLTIIGIGGTAISMVIMSAWQYKVNPVKALMAAFGYTENQAQNTFYVAVKSFQKNISKFPEKDKKKFKQIEDAKSAKDVNKAGQSLMGKTRANIPLLILGQQSSQQMITPPPTV